MTISKKRRFLIYERDGMVCFYCGQKCTEKELQLDHVIPRSSGGKSNVENLVSSCQKCNSIKSTLSQKEFLSKTQKKYIHHLNEANFFKRILTVLGEKLEVKFK